MPKHTKTRVAKLDTVNSCRTEMGKIYRMWRHGDFSNEQLRAGIYALKELRETLISSDLEARVAELERGQSYGT